MADKTYPRSVLSASKAKKAQDMLTKFRERYGINSTKIAQILGMSDSALRMALKQRGLRPEECQKLEKYLHNLGRELSSFSVPKNLQYIEPENRKSKKLMNG